jgi:hypothetical protein
MSKTEKREGLSSDCTLQPALVMAIMLGGREYPRDRCNMDRKVCRGYPRLDDKNHHRSVLFSQDPGK